MQNNRFNIFNQIHKGLRAMLYHTALRIQQTNFADADEAEETISEVETVAHVFEEHARHEDSFILPAIARFDADIITTFESEHEEDERLSCILLSAASAWRETNNPAIKASVGQIIFYQFNAFLAFNLYHMNKEETVLNNALWKHYSDEEIVCIMHAIIAAVPPQILALETRWMFRGLSNPEISLWLQQLKLEAPLEVFRIHAEIAEEELNPVRWNAINASLADAIMVN